ncbi:MAG: hypothetical protein ACRD3G_28060 [Vicinamibacterales bacterium]
MTFVSVTARSAVLRLVGAMVVPTSTLATAGLTVQAPIHAQALQGATLPTLRLPDESAGLDGIVRALIAAFDHVDILALGEDHGQGRDSDLRIALVRHPEFAKKVRSIVVEFGSASHQPTLDRYLRGEDVPFAQVEQVWKSVRWLSNGPISPIYPDFFAAVREVNLKLPADERIRVYGGDPGPPDEKNRDAFAVSLLKAHVLQQAGKALVLYGAAHFYRTAGDVGDLLTGAGGGIVQRLEVDYPGRTFAVIPVGSQPKADPPVSGILVSDYLKFDRALKTQVRPVLVSLARSPFRDFTAEEFVGGKLMNCRAAKRLPDDCVSVFKGSSLTLGQMADAAVYFGGGAEVRAKTEPVR